MPTPLRAVRVPDELWDAALSCTRADGRTVTDVVVEALRAYVDEYTAWQRASRARDAARRRRP